MKREDKILKKKYIILYVPKWNFVSPALILFSLCWWSKIYVKGKWSLVFILVYISHLVHLSLSLSLSLLLPSPCFCVSLSNFFSPSEICPFLSFPPLLLLATNLLYFARRNFSSTVYVASYYKKKEEETFGLLFLHFSSSSSSSSSSSFSFSSELFEKICLVSSCFIVLEHNLGMDVISQDHHHLSFNSFLSLLSIFLSFS